MGGTVLNSRDTAFGLARVLAEHRGEGCLVLDLGAASGWTDFFVIATATSSAHMRGLLRFVDEYVAQNGITRLNTPRVSDDEEWVLFDLGDVVVHLMTAQARSFYELEKLWFQAPASPVSALEAPQGPQ
jgi:ribosome-associated protein